MFRATAAWRVACFCRALPLYRTARVTRPGTQQVGIPFLGWVFSRFRAC